METENELAIDSENRPVQQSKPKRDYGLLLLELLTVSFGVMLGFMLNQLKEERKAQQKLETAITLVNKEIKNNLTEAERLFSDNAESSYLLFVAADSIDFYRKSGKAMFNVLNQEVTLYSSGNTAWETFKQMGLADQLDFKQVAAISEIYSTISFIEKNNDQLMGVLSNNNFFSKQYIEESYFSFLTLVNQQLNINAGIRKSIVGYLSEYDKELLADTIDYNKLRLDHLEKVLQTNFVRRQY